MTTPPTGLQVYQTGKLTVVGFGGQDVPDDYSIAQYRDHLNELIETHDCEKLAFDLTGVKLIPSGLLGVVASLSQREGLEVHLYNPSEDIREVLNVTNLNKLVEIREVTL